MSWACVQTYGACERKAVTHLRRQGFEAFSPFYIKPPHTVKKHGAKDAPLFPCYAFVEIVDDPAIRWQPINSTFGVIRLLTNRSEDNPRPIWVDDAKIAQLKLVGQSDPDSEGDGLLPPDTVIRVRHPDSAFYDKVGTVVEMDKPTRLTVLMYLFNRKVQVRFDSVEHLEVLALPGDHEIPVQQAVC
jgi:transcriptional antiterminator RfaH